MVYDFDIPLNKEIERTKKHLKELESKDAEAVLHCHICHEYFAMLGNYKQLKKCGKCYSKTKRKEMRDHVMKLINGTIENIEVANPDPLHLVDDPQISKILVKTKTGEIIELKKPKAVRYLL